MAKRRVKKEGVQPKITIAEKVEIDAEMVIEKTRAQAGNFLEFIQERNVLGLGVAVILGSTVAAAGKSFVDDVVDPLLALAIGSQSRLDAITIQLSNAEIRIGQFISSLIDVLLLALFLYVVFKLLRLDKLDKKKK